MKFRYLIPLIFCAPLMAQSTYTAASCNYSDVNAVINGPSHTVVNGDTIVIPAGSCTWTSSLAAPSGVWFTLHGNCTANSTPSTYGAGTLNTIITDAANTGQPLISATGFSPGTNQLMRISCLDIEPTTGNNLYSPLNIAGSCNASTCPNFRIDNIGIGLSTPWDIRTAGTNSDPIRADNVFGVIDHNTMGTSFYGVMAEINHSAYLGYGGNGDNSWAQPDSTGTANAVFVENNSVYNQQNLTETEFGAFGGGIGGSRQVCRFNQVTGYSQFSLCSGHGLESDGRPQGIRQIEAYNNSVFCASGSCTTGGPSYRSGGTGFTFNNAYTVASGQDIGWLFDMNAYRTMFNASYWGACGGSSPFDTNDTNGGGGNIAYVYYTVTITGASNPSGTNSAWNLTGTVAGSPWTTNQFIPNGAPFSAYDVTKNWWGQMASNTANTITVIDSIGTTGTGSYGFTVGDTVKIQRALVCGDQPGRGQGNYVSGTPPTPPNPFNQALSPIYEWNDSAGPGVIGVWRTVQAGQIIQNRDFYAENMNQGAQTSSSSPFDGTTTIGVGHGTLANRPATCTTGTAYWATDQGNWNLSGLSGTGTGVNYGGQGELFKCTNTSTPWTLAYQPYTYPHPLVSGSPSGVNLTVSTTGSSPCSVSGPNCSSGNYVSGTAIGPCTGAGGTGSTFSSWSTTGSAPSCPGSGTCPTSGSFSLTTPSSITATCVSGPSTCGTPVQTGPNYSGTYTNPPPPGASYTFPLSIGFTSPTPGCTMHATFDFTIPTCSSASYSGSSSISATTGIIVIACQSGYTPSSTYGGTWTVVGSGPPPQTTLLSIVQNDTMTITGADGSVSTVPNCSATVTTGCLQVAAMTYKYISPIPFNNGTYRFSIIPSVGPVMSLTTTPGTKTTSKTAVITAAPPGGIGVSLR